ncbi:hypothetical protein GPA25_22785 [Aromatoleum diolicum]|uniref:LysR substrate-binding domain-containing protein n=1 Tax=Aromatoleum diolicum TaxID=75796 RepID=A0ABX1QJ79_9RHOO|nr:hypothetical protein [Aromatoleum diolicum]
MGTGRCALVWPIGNRCQHHWCFSGDGRARWRYVCEVKISHGRRALIPGLQAGFFQRRLFKQRYVCMFRRGHPAASQPMTLDLFQSLEHVVVVSAGTGHGEIDTMLDRAGIRRRVRVVVPHFIAVGHILHSTDLIASVPERFAMRCVEPFDLVYVPHPATLPEIAIKLFRHAKYHRDPANRWLRQLLVEHFSDRRSRAARLCPEPPCVGRSLQVDAYCGKRLAPTEN